MKSSKLGECRTGRRALGVGVALVLALGACSGVQGEGGSSLQAAFDDDSFVTAPTEQGGVLGDNAPAAADRPSAPLPEEVEVEANFQTPVVTGRYVWSANPESGRVAVIDSETYEVRSVEAGFRPTQVASLAGEEGAVRAVVLNQGSSDATVVTLNSAGEFSSFSLPTHQQADRWSVQPQGKFAVAWTDASLRQQLDPTDGFQDITVLDLREEAAPQAIRLTVGYRPSAIYFNEVGDRAFAVTQDGISVVDLVATGGVSLRALRPLPSSPVGLPDVTVMPDGSRALARIAGETRIHLVDLTDGGDTSTLEVGGVLTDLDVSADGSMAVAVVRDGVQEVVSSAGDAGQPTPSGDAGLDAGVAPALDSGVTLVTERYSEAVYIPLPEGLSDPTVWQRVRSTTEVFGSVSVSPDASQAVLYTTTGNSGRVTLVNAERQVRAVDLFAPPRAVFITEDGSHSLILQEPTPGSVRRGAFSVVSLSDVRAPKRLASDAPTLAVALSPDSLRALVTVSDPAEGIFGAYLVRMPSLQVDFSSLPSRPLATGAIASAGKAFVSQAHPEGRLTFIDFESGDSRDITGFELSAKVVSE